MLGVQQVVYLIRNDDGRDSQYRRSIAARPEIAETTGRVKIRHPCRFLDRQTIRNLDRKDNQIAGIYSGVHSVFQNGQSPAGARVHNMRPFGIPTSAGQCGPFAVQIGIFGTTHADDPHLSENSILNLAEYRLHRSESCCSANCFDGALVADLNVRFTEPTESLVPVIERLIGDPENFRKPCLNLRLQHFALGPVEPCVRLLRAPRRARPSDRDGVLVYGSWL